MPDPARHLRATLLPDGDAPVDLWIVDGRLSFTPPAGPADELAADGGFVLPGLVDSHTHLTLDFEGGWRPGSPELVEHGRRAHAAAGTLLVRDIGSVSDAVLRAPDGDDLAATVPAGPLLAPAGRYFGFQLVTPPDRLAATAASIADAGYPWVKVVLDFPADPGTARSPLNYDLATLTEAVAAVHARGARIAVHAGGDGAPVAIAAGVDSIEHGFGLEASQMPDLAVRGIAWTPTSVIVDLIGLPEREVRDLHERLTPLLVAAERAGVTILAGTDMLPPGSVAEEVASLAAHGLSPRAALAAATTAPRAFLGRQALADGAPADVVVFRHDPRQDPHLLARPDLVLRAGRIIATGAGPAAAGGR
jgi:imidazolonepropionase-like amidohydrolase